MRIDKLTTAFQQALQDAQSAAVARDNPYICLLYTSDAADERSSVDLGGRRIIKKKKNEQVRRLRNNTTNNRYTKQQ